MYLVCRAALEVIGEFRLFEFFPTSFALKPNHLAFFNGVYKKLGAKWRIDFSQVPIFRVLGFMRSFQPFLFVQLIELRA